MTNFSELSNEQLTSIDGGTFEIYFLGKIFSGIAAGGIIGVAVIGVVGVGCFAYYVASKN